ncbi:MAG: adenylyl-sulfate kinase, partial [Chloroflexota bacterium]|nr:adenylyl-sulfate kinase [Chloroflexota bacterium]
VAYAFSEDIILLGRTVLAVCVNAVLVRRSAWRNVARRAGKRCIEIEIVCSDQAEHRPRVESRVADIVGHQLPTWQQVCAREYEPWPADLVIDTAGQHIEASVSALRARLEGLDQDLRAAGDAEE